MQDTQAITQIIESYFHGTYHGDAQMLREIFHPQAYITGNINNQIVDWQLDDFIARVTTKPTAAEKKEVFDKRIIAIDQTANAAMVKARVVVSGMIFTDYITLLKMDGKWRIRNKGFTSSA